ncbi:MAG: glycosyltransferase family 4 protein [Deltaproteobacteria bacterium]|nr:glycosyltransferase family 4 protein [Deltaproteobacteria bacterium]
MIGNISYIISQYPDFHETFIAREIDSLLRNKVNINIYSLKTPPEEIQNLYMKHKHIVRYSPFLFDKELIKDNLIMFFGRPCRYMAASAALVKLYWNNPLELLKAFAVFPKTVSYARKIETKSEVFHAHWATIPAAMAVVVKTLTKIPFTVTAHAWDVYLSRPEQLREKISCANGVVTCTSYNMEYLRSVCREEDRCKIIRNYHGLDFSWIDEIRSNGKSDPGFHLVAVGRLVEQKGFVYLIKAVGILGARGIKTRLIIIGDGPLREELEREAAGIGEYAAVIFAGRVPHKETIATMKASDALVAPSVISANGDRDGIPNVVLEAMACGIPVVGTNVSGIPEVVIDGKTGFLVDSGDPEELADALEKIHRDPDSGKHMGREGRGFVEEHFDVGKNVEEFIEILNGFHNRNFRRENVNASI